MAIEEHKGHSYAYKVYTAFEDGLVDALMKNLRSVIHDVSSYCDPEINFGNFPETIVVTIPSTHDNPSWSAIKSGDILRITPHTVECTRDHTELITKHDHEFRDKLRYPPYNPSPTSN